jgi:DNA-binding XRE family transcriptional regulator
MIFTAREKRAVAKRFIAFRKKNLMNQTELAALLDVWRETVSHIETGRKMPHRSTLKKFALLEAKGRTKELRAEYTHRKIGELST